MNGLEKQRLDFKIHLINIRKREFDNMKRFIGKWKNKSGNILKIEPNDKQSLKVSFVSGKTGKPVIREYLDGKESVEMYAELDFYESSLEVELWENGKGFQLSLLYDWMDYRIEPGYRLAPGLVQNVDDNLTEKYGHLFMPLEHYKQIEK